MFGRNLLRALIVQKIAEKIPAHISQTVHLLKKAPSQIYFFYRAFMHREAYVAYFAKEMYYSLKS